MSVPEADPEIIMSCMEAITLGFETVKKIVSYIYKKEYKEVHSSYKTKTKTALLAGQELGMFHIKDMEDIYSSKIDLVKSPKYQDWTDGSKQLIFREYLQQYEPYIRFHSFLELGNNSDSAIRRVSTYYGWSPMLQGMKNTLAIWGLYAGTLEEEDSIVISQEVGAKSVLKTTPIVSDFIESLDTQIASASFILSFLGQKCYDFLTVDIKSDLTKAMSLAINKPDDSVKAMGTALEDYIKLMASDRNVLLEQNGKPIKTIGVMIDKLRSQRVLANHHVNSLKGLEVYTSSDLFQGLNAYRTMPVHGRDPEADMRWSLSTEVAIVSSLQLLLSIRSTYHYIVEKRLRY